MKYILTFIILTTIFSSCAPSAEDVAKQLKALQDKEKHIQDSLISIEEDRFKRAADSAADALLRESERALRESNLIQFRADLTAAEIKLQDLMQPKFLRTPAEKDYQISQQTLLIETLRKKISDLESESRQNNAVVEFN